jgi:YHS domain-containing protein
MFRALLELFITIVAAMVARAIISSVMKGLSNASASAFQQQQAPPNPSSSNPQSNSNSQSNPVNNGGPANGSVLHKDPVCGTYVSEGTGFRKQTSGQTFYYCSQACKDKHSLVAR